MDLFKVIFIFLMCVVPSMQISYECEENGDITLIGLTQNSTVTFLSMNNVNGSGECIKTKEEMQGKVTIPVVCVPAITVNRTVKIQIYDPFVDKRGITTPAPIPAGRRKRDIDLSHSDHFFNIRCLPLDKAGVVQHVIQQLPVENVAPLQIQYNSVGKVEMRFKAEERTTMDRLMEIPDISSVYLGDKFYMYLKYTGTQKGYIISPQNCTAFDGDWPVSNSPVKNVILWTYETCVSDASKNYHLMHNFKNVDQQTVYAEMYGFHFGADKDITIACDVRICPQTDHDQRCNLKPENDHTCQHEWVRRKRSIGSENNVRVMRKLQIKDSKPMDNAAGMFRNSWLLVFFVQFYLTYM